MAFDSFNDILDSRWGQSLSKKDKLIQGKILRINKHFLTIDIGGKKPIQIPFNINDNYFKGVKEEEVITLRYDDSFDLEENKRTSLYTIIPQKSNNNLDEILKVIFNNKDLLNGLILNEVKGGYSVGIGGVVAFLPKSQISIPSSVSFKEAALNRLKTFSVLSLDEKNKNIVVSRLKTIQQNKNKKFKIK